MNNSKLPFSYFLLFLSLFFPSCEEKEVINLPVNSSNQYLFLGHTYDGPNRVDARLERLDYSQYTGLWLGGDLCAETTRRQSTLDYLDALFDLGNEDTHWAVGNHDVRNGNLDRITEKTGRNLFYAQTKNDLTIIVLDTNMGHVSGRGASCEDRKEQADFIRRTLDTLPSSSHLVLLMHWVIWGETDANIPCRALANNCLSTFQFICGDPSTRFPPFLYEKLVEIEQNGTDVIVVSGDGGIFTKKYEYQTKEGIDFLISGLYTSLDRNNPPANVEVNLNPDSVLVFTHFPEERKLDWEFIRLDNLK
ncbi:MAG: hypothetical protein AAF960_25235 [Bacteroidota bacterium]